MRRVSLQLVLFFIVSTVVAQVPTITNFDPQKASSGKQITITGSNFNATSSQNIVYFGATRGIIVASTATTIIVLAPVGALYAPITVYNAETRLSATSAKYFIPTFYLTRPALKSTDFLTKFDYPAGKKPTALALGDYDSDGRTDLLVTTDVNNASSRSIYSGLLYTNTAIPGAIDSLSLSLPEIIPTGFRPQAAVLTDLYCTGRLAIATANFQSNSVSFGSAFTSLGAIGPIDIAAADIDGDGKTDIISANALGFGISVFQNTNIFSTSLSFAARVDFTTGFQPMALAAGDIDGDGKPDIVVANSNIDSTFGLAILRNTSTTGTIDANSFAPAINFTTGQQAKDVALADVDGDGKLDVIVVNQNANTISVLRNTATAGSITAASLAPKVDFATGIKPRSVAVGDLNGDAKPDIVVANQNSNSVSVFQNSAVSGRIDASSLAVSFALSTGEAPYGVAVGDIDGDGSPDIEAVNYEAGTLSVIKNEPVVTGFNGFGKKIRSFYREVPTLTDHTLNAMILPNPANDHATLLLGRASSIVDVTLFNASGIKLWERQGIKEKQLRLPVQNLSNGIYFILVKDLAHTVSLKLVKT